jgi:hypothetical protein
MKTNILIEKLQKCKSAEDLLSLQKDLKGVDVGFNFADQRAYVKFDLRKAIRSYMSENEMSIKQFAALICYDYSAMKAYLVNRRNLTYEKVEEVQGLLILQKKEKDATKPIDTKQHYKIGLKKTI